METVILKTKPYAQKTSMISDMSSVFALFILSAPLLLLIMLLPYVLELKKPRDAGPRFIMDNFSGLPQLTNMAPLVDIEEGPQIEAKLGPSILGVLSFLPKLDA
jgi:hypothetical protein